MTVKAKLKTECVAISMQNFIALKMQTHMKVNKEMWNSVIFQWKRNF